MADPTLLDKLTNPELDFTGGFGAIPTGQPPESPNPLAPNTAKFGSSAAPIQGKPITTEPPKPLFFDEGAPVVPPFQQAQTLTKQQQSLERPNLSSDEIEQQRRDQIGANALEAQSLAQGREASLGANEQKAQALRNDQRGMGLEKQRLEEEATSIKKGVAMLEATKIDESDWWRDGGSGRTVAAFLALAAGGFVNAIKPGSSSASEIIFGAIDKYVQRKVGEKNETLKRRGDLLGDNAMAQRMLKVDIRKSVLDQAALMAQRGEIDTEFGKVMANLYHQNAKELNAFALDRAGKVTTTQIETEKPASPVPWAQYGMDQKRWDRFVQGEDKKAGAASLVTGVRDIQNVRGLLDHMKRDNGDLPNYGAFEALLPESVKNFAARLGVDRATDMIQARQLIDRKVLDIIRTMNSRLVDSDQERMRMQGQLEKGNTDTVYLGLQSMQNQLEQELKDRAVEAQVPGVDPNDMVRYVAQQRGAQDRQPGDATVLRGPQAAQPGALEQQQQDQPQPGQGYIPQMTGEASKERVSWPASSSLTPEKGTVIKAVATESELDPTKMARVFFKESAGTFDPAVKNPRSSATGLMQWMEGNYPGGRSREQVQQMSFQEQTKAAAEWMKNAGVTKDSPLIDYYAAVAAPGVLKKVGSLDAVPGGTVIYRAGTKEAKANEGWQDYEGKVTIDSLKKFIGGGNG